MKELIFYCTELALLMGLIKASAGEFVNLDFNNPDFTRIGQLPLKSPKVGPIDEFLRGWKVETRTSALAPWQPLVGDVEFTLTGAGSGISYAYLAVDNSVDPRNFGVFLGLQEPLGGDGGSISRDVRIYQSGLIPINARTLEMVTPAQLTIIDGDHSVDLPINNLSYDVSALSGREVTISFLMQKGTRGEVDLVGFGLIPEPATSLQFMVGVVVLVGFGYLGRRCRG